MFFLSLLDTNGLALSGFTHTNNESNNNKIGLFCYVMKLYIEKYRKKQVFHSKTQRMQTTESGVLEIRWKHLSLS